MQILEHVIGKYFLLFEHLIGLAWGVHYLFGTQMFAQNLNDTYPKSRKGKLHKIMEIISRLVFVSATSLIVLRMYNFGFNIFSYYHIAFFPAKVTTNV